jgi:hypothetical protein
MPEDTSSTAEQRANRLFLTEICATETYKEIQTELVAKHEDDSLGDLPEAYFSELSSRLKDLFNRCAAMCES